MQIPALAVRAKVSLFWRETISGNWISSRYIYNPQTHTLINANILDTVFSGFGSTKLYIR